MCVFFFTTCVFRSPQNNKMIITMKIYTYHDYDHLHDYDYDYHYENDCGYGFDYGYVLDYDYGYDYFPSIPLISQLQRLFRKGEK